MNRPLKTILENQIIIMQTLAKSCRLAEHISHNDVKKLEKRISITEQILEDE